MCVLILFRLRNFFHIYILGCSARWRINLPLLPQVLEHMEYPFQALFLQCNVLTICALLSKYSLFLSLKISATFCDWLESTKTILCFDLSFGAKKSKILAWPVGSSWAQCQGCGVTDRPYYCPAPTQNSLMFPN